jgi:hypothetical protein
MAYNVTWRTFRIYIIPTQSIWRTNLRLYRTCAENFIRWNGTIVRLSNILDCLLYYLPTLLPPYFITSLLYYSLLKRQTLCASVRGSNAHSTVRLTWQHIAVSVFLAVFRIFPNICAIWFSFIDTQILKKDERYTYISVSSMTITVNPNKQFEIHFLKNVRYRWVWKLLGSNIQPLLSVPIVVYECLRRKGIKNTKNG